MEAIELRVVGGVDGTRTRGLRRDRQEPLTVERSRPRKIGVGSPARSPFDAYRGRLFRNFLQVLASAGTVGRGTAQTAAIGLCRERCLRVTHKISVGQCIADQ